MKQVQEKLVVIIDDDPTTRAFLKFYLDSSGYRTLLANEWSEGRVLIEYLSPKLIIVDGLLPNYDGIKICKAVRNRFDEQSLPIILLTNFFHGGQNAMVAQRDARANLFLRKPVEQLEIQEAIRHLIGEANRFEDNLSVVPPSRYEGSKKAYLKLIKDFDSASLRMLDQLDRGIPPTPKQWLSSFEQFTPTSSSCDQTQLYKLDVDQMYCKKVLCDLAQKILSVRQILAVET